MEPRLRQLVRSLDASRIFVDLAITQGRWERAGERERWPRPGSPPLRPHPPSRSHLRRVGLLLSSIVVAAAITQQNWSTQEAPRVPSGPPVAAVPPISAALPPASHQRPVPTSDSLIYIKALRSCSVRLVVDGTALSWRLLQAGDEFFSRPRQQLIIETNDWDALYATLDGRPLSLGPNPNVINVN